jgi:hypothetical protein
MHTVLHVKYQLFLKDFKDTWILSTDFRNKLKYQIPSKSAQQGSLIVTCGQTDGQADMTKQIVAVHNFANAPKTT